MNGVKAGFAVPNRYYEVKEALVAHIPRVIGKVAGLIVLISASCFFANCSPDIAFKVLRISGFTLVASVGLGFIANLILAYEETDEDGLKEAAYRWLEESGITLASPIFGCCIFFHNACVVPPAYDPV